MRNLGQWLLGLTIGMAAGWLFMALFSPVSGEQFRSNLRRQFAEARAAGRQAASERRAELEADLENIRQARAAGR
jgi:gas vesicle protein